MGVAETLKLGTRKFMSPELLGNDDYGKNVDTWALGVVIYQYISKQFPFDGRNKA